MKIKNMKLMLLGLLTVMGVSNAFAAATLDESGRSVNGVNYECWSDGDNHYAIVVGVNNKATTAEQENISIPATVTGEKFTYKVQEFKAGWESAILDVTTKTKSLSIDITNFTAALSEAAAFNNLKALESLTITDANAADKAKTTKIDCSSAKFNGTLKSYNFSGSKINELAANCFKGFTALEAIDLTGIKTIGANAFDGAGSTTAGKEIGTITIPNTVESIGASAFANMSKPTKVVINASDKIAALPATCFDGDNDVKELVISGNKLATIPAGAFTTKKLETLDLSGCKALATITGAFDAANAYKKVYLAGTAITNITTDPSLAASAGSLEEITFPAKITTLPSFKNFVKLKKVDLSGTAVKAIPASEFEGCAVLEEAILNAETASIGASAFKDCKKLATITNLGNSKMTTLGANAFENCALTTVDLSGANIATIPTECFKNNKKLETVKLNDKVTAIADFAFAYAVKLSSINLENTKITTLNNIFTGKNADDETAPCDALTTLTLPSTLKTINSYALQMLGLTEITIPSSVTSFGTNVLQGCLNLKKFVWNDIDNAITSLDINTFLGDDKLEEVRFMTQTNPMWTWLTDDHFKGNNKDVLKVYVTGEVYNRLVANGWTPGNAKYSTLVGEEEVDFAFNAKAKSDGYYYATYKSKDYATWFSADDFEVFTAVIDGSNVVLKKADVENGYYKVAKWDGAYGWTGNHKTSVCVIRSTKEKAKIEKKYAGFNDNSTLPTDNGLQVSNGVTASRLKFQYKLGIGKDGSVKFWRVTSGQIKKDVVYLDLQNPKAPEFMDIVVEGEMNNKATGIDAIETVNEENSAIYNLQGVRTNGAKKGLYIQNGKKFIVK